MSSGDRSCYKCGKTGHFARECNSQRGPPGGGGFARDNSGYSSSGDSWRRSGGGNGRGDSRGSGCYNCGREGHISRNCPEGSRDSRDRSRGGPSSRGGGGGGRNCYNCGEPGHFARDCVKGGSRDNRSRDDYNRPRDDDYNRSRQDYNRPRDEYNRSRNDY